MTRTRTAHRTAQFGRLFELIRQQDQAMAMTRPALPLGADGTSEMQAFQRLAAGSLSPE